MLLSEMNNYKDRLFLQNIKAFLEVSKGLGKEMYQIAFVMGADVKGIGIACFWRCGLKVG